MDKLAENLQKLSEDNLLSVVQMIHDNKTEETYTKNDLDRKSPPAPTFYQAFEANSYPRGRIPRRFIYPSRYSCERFVELFRTETQRCLTISLNQKILKISISYEGRTIGIRVS